MITTTTWTNVKIITGNYFIALLEGKWYVGRESGELMEISKENLDKLLHDYWQDNF